MSGINELLGELDNKVKYEIETPATIKDIDEFPDVDNLLLEKREWARLHNVVAVVVDLKNSTKLDFKRRASTSAQLYEAVTGSCARIVTRFRPGFVDIIHDNWAHGMFLPGTCQ